MPAPARAFTMEATIDHYDAAETPDDYGDRPPTQTTSERVRCNLQPTASADSSANEARETTLYNLYLPAGVDVGGQDRVTVGTLVMVATGPGIEFNDFRGEPHHVEATLRRVT